jgi:hypothetical protein
MLHVEVGDGKLQFIRVDIARAPRQHALQSANVGKVAQDGFTRDFFNGYWHRGKRTHRS